jgi:acetyl-CoA C-acetyltransferase
MSYYPIKPNAGGRVAVIGAGMTRFMRRAKESPGELTALAVQQALDDAGLTIDDIDAVCLGTAPDAFDGIHMNGENLIAGAGATHKPYLRHYVGGGTGVMSPIHGWMHVASGKFKTCLVVAEEKMSPCNPHPAGAFITIFDHTTEQPLELTLIHIFAIEMCRFMHVYGYSEEEIAQVSVMCKKNALDHPAAQIPMKISVKDVMNSPVLSWPVKRFDISPTSDAAVAIVLSNEHVARTHCKHPVFIEGVGFRLDTAYWNTRDLGFPNYVAMAARDAYQMAGISNPAEQIDIFEPYDPFDYKALHHMNALLLDKSGRKVHELLNSGAFERTGSHPMCPSGGLLGVGNPIAAAGLMKIAELYFQIAGKAGARQVKKSVHRGVAQAWGDLMQVGTVVVMGSEGGMPHVKHRWNTMKPADLGGTPLKDVSDVPNIAYKPDLRYAWDNGMALTTYLDGFKQGKLRGSQCSRCGRTMIPARAFCEICNLDSVHDYCDLADWGTVQTFTLSRVNWDSSPLPKGKVNIFAVIAIDGITPEMGLCHMLGEVDPKDVKVGMRVKAVWKKAAERTGTVKDILYFRPVKPSEKLGDATPRPIKPVELTAETARAFPGRIPLSYIYTAGTGGTKFYEDLSRGKLSGVWCPECETVHLPPAGFCERSMQPLDPKKDARAVDPRTGLVTAFSVVFEDRAGHPMAKPEVVVQVNFPDADGCVFGKLQVKDPAEVEVGLPVELVKVGKTIGPDQVWFKPRGRK